MSEYPQGMWTPAHPTNYKPSGRTGFSNIVIHCTDGHGDAGPVADMWKEPDHKSSAHFVIGQTGEVIQCVSLQNIAWHAHSANATSIGIEHCARTPRELGPQDPGLVPSFAQYDASAKLVAWLINRSGLSADRSVIVGHAEIDTRTTHTQCPVGCGWDWDLYMSMIKMHLEEWELCT